jgi:DNA-binding FadR family transcriptional regulator
MTRLNGVLETASTNNAAKAGEEGTTAIESHTGLVKPIIHKIIALIREQGLKPGAPIPSEGALALTFGVSRAVIREALRSLAALTLIDVGNGRRARVRVPDASVLGLVVDHAVFTEHVSIQQIFDVRRSIEMRTVALAALRRSSTEAREICAYAAAMREDFHQPAQAMLHDIAFHYAIGVASRNPIFSMIIHSFEDVTRKTWRVAWYSRPSDKERMENVAAHEAVAAAILAQDPRAAQAAMAQHFDDSVKALLDAGIN